MKRWTIWALAALLLITALCGCGKKDAEGSESEDETAASESTEPSESTETEKSDVPREEESPREREDSSSDEKDESAGQSADDAGAGEETSVSPSVTGALHVEGTQLVGSHGEKVQLRGISTHGLAWFPQYVNEECFADLKSLWGANVVRLAMYTAESGGYCTDGDKEALKDLIRKGVAYAKAQDLYVIIDWHILSDSNPNMHKDEAADFFAEMAAEFAGEEHVLYEICNEPNGGTSWSDIRAYAETIIPIIREKDEDAVILVGTPNWSQFVDQAAADPITGYENIMYTLHFYAATHTDSLRETLKNAVEDGLPVFVSEYGICDASGNGAIDEGQAGQWVDLLDTYGISYVAWNLSNKNETSALLDGACDKISGFTEDDLSASGRWLYALLNGNPAEDRAAKVAVGEDSAMKEEEAGSGIKDADSRTLRKDGLMVKVSVMNSWESNGQKFSQYTVTVTNDTEKPVSGWTIDIEFSEEFSLSDGWNGEYTSRGATLTITSKDYNREIAPGAAVSDIGFIACGGGEILS